jgi:CRISPR-associated endonuclease Cas1
MRAQGNDASDVWPEEMSAIRGNIVVSGYGCRVSVWRGRLLVEDGIGAKRRRAVVHRVIGNTKRLVVLGHTGSISLEAIRWLNDVGAGYVQIDADGKLLASWGSSMYDQPRLRRAQAKALGTDEGLSIAKALIELKLSGQEATLTHIAEQRAVDGASVSEVADARSHVAFAKDADELRLIESDGAAAYWRAWRDLPVKFVARDMAKVPTHWRAFGTRTSGLKGGPRAATNPANALLNYLYALVEAETVIAAQTVGLLPDLGVFHYDHRYRNSLAADLMEPIRPTVDRYLFDVLNARSFADNDFFETRTGVCRLTPRLTSELAATRAHWSQLAGPVAEQVAHALLAAPSWEPLARLMTRPSSRRQDRTATSRPDKRTSLPGLERRCGECGSPIPDPNARTCSEPCLKKLLVRTGHEGAAKLQERMRELRASGDNPSGRPRARARQAAGLARRQAERAAWEAQNPGPYDGEAFRSEVLPLLAAVSIPAIQRATGLSTAQAWRIRKGVVPHPMWWDALADVASNKG